MFPTLSCGYIFVLKSSTTGSKKEEKIIDRRMKPIETHSRLRARLLKDWGHWKYHFHDLMTSNP